MEYKRLNEMTSKAIKVQGHAVHLLENLNKQRDNKVFCDIVLKVQGKHFSAHRNVLSACSDYFHTMLHSKMQDQYATDVHLEGMTAAAVEQILEYMYTEEVYLSEDNVSDVMQAASLMLMTDLLEVISNYLLESVSPSTCLYLRDVSKLFNLKSLKKKAEKCIFENFEEIAFQDKFCDLSVDDVAQILSSCDLKVQSENIVFEALVCWVNKHQKQRKSQFPSLFKHVRLQHISQHYLTNNLRKQPLVKQFRDSRDLVDDALHFHIEPNLFEVQKPRRYNASSGDGATSNKSSAAKLKKHRLGLGPVPPNLRRFVNALTEVPEDDCYTCMAKLHEESGFAQTSAASSFCHAVQLNKCKHMFHTPCIKAAMDNDSSKAGLMCPYCKTIYGTKTGTQPDGRMTSRSTPVNLPGYSCGTIIITYDIRSGTQGPEHPNPGRRYQAPGFPRSAYLPLNKDGKKILKMLEVAWERRLIFTVGRSMTSGANDVVTWNEIHHKTSMTRHGSHCYPDPNYFNNVTEELEAQGVTEADIK